MATQLFPDVTLAELVHGQEADFFALLSHKEELTTKDGKPYFKVTFRDANREVSFPIWNDSAWAIECRDGWCVATFYKLRATYRDTNFGPQLEIKKIRPVEDGDAKDGFNPRMMQAKSRFDSAEMFDELLELAKQKITDKPLKRLTVEILETHRELLMTFPAARKNHHAYVGGWLEHTLSVTRTAVFLAEKYDDYYPDMQPRLDKSVVAAGAILHDIGKLREYDHEPQGAVYTAEGALIGHMLQGRDIVRDAAAGSKIAPETMLRLEHVIIAHQGRPEWGAPKVPMTPEAMIVHYADDLDAKYAMIYTTLRDDKSTGPMTSRKNQLYQQIFRGLEQAEHFGELAAAENKLPRIGDQRMIRKAIQRHSGQSLTEGPIWIALVRLSIPIIASNILQVGYQLTDTFWVGRLSAAAVAAVSLSFPISFLCISLGGGLPIAGTVLIAQYRGKQDERAINQVAGQTFLMCLLISVSLAVVGFVFAQPIMRFMGAAPDVLPDAVRFLQVTFLGFVFVFGFFAYQALMRGLGTVYPPMFIVLATVILNFILDPFFIFGFGPVPAMGVAGAAMATLCTQALAMVIGLVLMTRARHGIHLHWRNFRPDWRMMGTLLKIGAPASIEQSTQALGMTLMMLLVSTFGTNPVAAYGIGMRILSCAIIPAMGLSLATSTLVGQNIGAGRMKRAVQTSNISCAISFSVLVASGLIFFFIARPMTAFFIPKGGEAIDESVTLIRILTICFGFVGLQQVLTGTLRGAGDTLAPMLLAIISLWILRFPLAYVLSKHTALGAVGIWWAVAISIMASAILASIYYLRGDWKKRRLLDEVRSDAASLEDSAERQMAMEEGLPF